MSNKQQVSDLVAQGWEIVGFSTASILHTQRAFEKERQHKIVTISDRPCLASASGS